MFFEAEARGRARLASAPHYEPKHRKLLRKREAATAVVTKWALAAAVIACEPLLAGSDRRNAH